MTKSILFSLALISVLGPSSLCFAGNQKDIERVIVDEDFTFFLPLILQDSSVKLTQVKKGDKVVVTGKSSDILILTNLVQLVNSGKPGSVSAFPPKTTAKNGKMTVREWTSLGFRKDSRKLFSSLRGVGLKLRKVSILHFGSKNVILIYGTEKETATVLSLLKTEDKKQKARAESKK